MRRDGFTLIELLVVIAIIAILAAILFPIFVTARETARRSECLSNISQLGKAMVTYGTDYNGRIPQWWFSWVGPWDVAIYRYTKTKKLYACPVNRIDPRTHRPWMDENHRYIMVRSYAMAKNISGQIVEQVPRPSMTVLLMEKGSRPFGDGADAVAEWFTQTVGYAHNPATEVPKFWHGDGKNFVFCDGHAHFFRYPSGPFSYDFHNFMGWRKPGDTSYRDNPGGPGYCGFADNTKASVPKDKPNLPGANMPGMAPM